MECFDVYEDAMRWLEGNYSLAQMKGDHHTQRMIEAIKDRLLRLDSLED